MVMMLSAFPGPVDGKAWETAEIGCPLGIIQYPTTANKEEKKRVKLPELTIQGMYKKTCLGRSCCLVRGDGVVDRRLSDEVLYTLSILP